MANLVLIDGNNLAHRVFWAHSELSHRGKRVGLLYGFLKSLASLKKTWGAGWFYLIAWDSQGGSARRHRETNAAMQSGMVDSSYKAGRSEPPEELLAQMEELPKVLAFTSPMQVAISGVEADDIIYSYAQHGLETGREVVIVSSDHDFLQVLAPGVTVHDAMKHKTWTAEKFTEEYGFPPAAWVDVGALMGDGSDNIPGVPGWGEKTATDYVRQYGSLNGIIEAVANKPAETRSRRECTFLSNLPLANLSYSLKQMDRVPSVQLPKLKPCPTRDLNALKAWLIDMRFASLLKDAPLLVF